MSEPSACGQKKWRMTAKRSRKLKNQYRNKKRSAYLHIALLSLIFGKPDPCRQLLSGRSASNRQLLSGHLDIWNFTSVTGSSLLPSFLPLFLSFSLSLSLSLFLSVSLSLCLSVSLSLFLSVSLSLFLSFSSLPPFPSSPHTTTTTTTLRGPATVSWWRGLVASRSDLNGD